MTMIFKMRTAVSKQMGGAGAWLLVFGAVATCVAGFIAVRWMTKAPDSTPLDKKPAVVTVETAKAVYQNMADSIALNGTVAARDRLQVASELGGVKISEVLVEEGDTVRKGQLLAVLNTDVNQARLAQLQANKDQQQAALAKARQPQRPLEIAQLESAWRQAKSMIEQEKSNYRLIEAAYKNAQANVTRYESLYTDGAVPETEAENRRLELSRQQAQLKGAQDRIESAGFAARQAEERLRLAQEGGRSEDVAIVQAQIRALDAQIQEIQVLIDQGRIEAPSDGWILSRQARLGDVTSNGKVLFELAKDSQLELIGQLPATLLGKIQVGETASVRHDEKSISARVWKISPLVDAENRNAAVRIALPSNSGLRPGMFADATIDLGETKSMTVPLEAVRGESPDYYVFTLAGNQAKRQNVAVIRRAEGQAVIESGLKVGDEVIIQGGGFLRDGDTVARP